MHLNAHVRVMNFLHDVLVVQRTQDAAYGRLADLYHAWSVHHLLRLKAISLIISVVPALKAVIGHGTFANRRDKKSGRSEENTGLTIGT